MFKTIFSRLIAMFLLILIIAFTITGVMLSLFLDKYVTEEKAEALETAGSWINLVFINYLQNIDVNDYLSSVRAKLLLQDSLVAFGNYTNSYIWIVSQEGYLFQSNWDMPKDIADKYTDETSGYVKIPSTKQFPKLIEKATTTSEVGDFGGFFKEDYFDAYGDVWLTVGRSFEYTGANGEDIMIVIYMHTPVAEVISARKEVLKYFLISGGVAVAIAVILTYIFSLRLSRPLKQIKNAAAKISSGEFERRLDIKSNDEIGELAKAFNQMAVALQSIEEMRREFIANVSHELRTPMTSIRGFIEGILDGTIPPEKHNKYLSIVKDETNRLNRLVNDLLDLAKIEAGEVKLNITTLDINEMVRKSVIKLEALLVDKELSVDADFEEEELLAKGDSDAIERVLYNLMHNAIKFTPAGGKIAVSTRKLKDHIGVTIRDSGVGIDQNELEQIWDRFYKSDKSRGRDKTGTGLGLAIVRNIINEHNQTVSVQSEPGRGTAFTFTLARCDRDDKDAEIHE